MGAQVVRETERKYEADADFSLPDLVGVGGVTAVRGPERSDLDASYFDTQDLRLARAGITLRRRTGGGDAGWHAKLPVGPDTRDEVRFPLGRAKKTVPAALAALVRAHTLDEPLVPVARIVTRRDEWTLLDADGEQVALLADDHVTAVPTDGKAATWRELEVEATDAAALDPIGEALGARPSSSASKLVRTLGKKARRQQPPALPKHPTAGEAALLYVRERFDDLRAHDTGVRLDAEDSIHQFRVTCRRMRSALQAFRPLFDADRVAALREEFRWLGAELAPARDAEVLQEHLLAEVERLPTEVVLGGVAARLTAEFARVGADARGSALAVLDGDRYKAVLVDLAALLADPPFTAKAARPAAGELRKAVRKSADRLTASVEAADTAASPADRDTALHQARKDAKKARYTVEAVDPVLGRELRKWRKRVKGVQTALGVHQDAVVAREALRDLGVRVHLEGDNAFTYGLLWAREDTRAHTAEAEFVAAWARLCGSKGPHLPG
ncbi:CYTH and CHAD domain-containing protein [Actinokineospora sp. PR83]|uniref:CYTH and CHAD domain-containing protein n=1 Tax=Actinokineospora sp. PR83 TaxID=2884908 RepID=UPI001F40A6F0|nr:CYTH and CHAD domain-containing protein [Actinokineospora sp. PR83]MCG8920334.1 CYTH and CHAD domain-containing protein [Actinokineospora sp. PR83]